MKEKLFLAKIKNSDDRDVVKYVEFKGFECNHYFSGLHIMGACTYGFEKEFRQVVEHDFDNLETILTQAELLKLFELNDKLKNLGYGIEIGSERYRVGMEIIKEYEDTIKVRLSSEDNQKLFEKVIKEEKNFMQQQYDLTEEEVNMIFDNYNGTYQDRAIVNCVYDNLDEFVEEEKIALGYADIPYFDDKAFGEDLLEDGYSLQLKSGKIVSYIY